MDLVAPEIIKLQQLQSQKLSLFNVLGRTMYSLQTTKLVLVILHKSVLEDDDEMFVARYLSRLVGILDLAEGEMDKLLNSWVVSWFK